MPTLKFLCFKERDPCKTLYLDSTTHMPAGVLTSGANIFGFWILNETQTYNNRPVYHHELFTSLYLYRVHPVKWVIRFDNPVNVPVDSPPNNTLGLITDQSIYPEDIKAPISINLTGSHSEWPGAAFSCFSVSRACNELSISGISTDSQLVIFNGLYTKKDSEYNYRPYYEHHESSGNQRLLVFRWSYWNSPPAATWQLLFHGGLANYVYEFIYDPLNIRFDWADQ
ncbi:unnamed protein product, partial [Owenia fusiformis]